jgi:hypothetical protein
VSASARAMLEGRGGRARGYFARAIDWLALEGRRFLGVEVAAEYAQIARDRIAATGSQINLADYRAGQKPLFRLETPAQRG